MRLLTGHSSGKQAAHRLRAQARERRIGENLCTCSDDVRVFATKAEMELAVKMDVAVRCEQCGKERLPVFIVNAELVQVMKSKPERAETYLRLIESIYR
jgi:hypothetical protein